MKWLDRKLIIGPYLRLCLSEKEYLAELKRLGVRPEHPWVSEGADATTHTLESQGRICCLVCLKPKKGKCLMQIHAILVHEAVHVFQSAMEGMGEDKPGREIEAYSIQNIAQELMVAYDKQKRRK